jgi:hypothetical protein
LNMLVVIANANVLLAPNVEIDMTDTIDILNGKIIINIDYR